MLCVSEIVPVRHRAGLLAGHNKYAPAPETDTLMAERVLVVEDHLETRDAIILWLELFGYEVITANDGQEGLESARAEKPDLIVTDIQMPYVDGIEMIKRLRSTPECCDVPILVVTAYEMDYAKEAIEAGANRALAKPIDPDLLHPFIKDLLKDKAAPSPTSQ
jgi:CheY-like chemotaxis protein